MKKNVIIPFFLLFFINVLFSQDKIKVAILNFVPKGVDATLTEAIVENLTTALIDTKKYEVIERNQIDKLMAELKLQNSDDFNENLREELGNLYGVKLVILGSVTKIGNNITINIRGVEVSTGSAQFAKNITTKNEDDIPELINVLIGELTETKVKKIENKKSNRLNNVNIAGISLITVGSVSLLSGLTVLIIDLAYLGPKQDAIIANKEPYENWQKAHNDFIGGLVGGIVPMSIGAILIIPGIAMSVYKDKSISFDIETGMDSMAISFCYKF
ncbi:MAG TPA: CsgG/HfaB family protein [Spirochaetota bacterium]|jgi:TolB-like protein|nr:MAG: Curli production assembly/transport component CsgG [Spirochaetes bacterium ADurb.Bin133]HNZ25821.1 CsgG/HfaB family protein [Spirochaetota bacterium]HPY88734.1 CsgG/HfaB family protein [Spirochaetota bacterium]